MLHVVGARGVAEAWTQMRDRSSVSRLLEQAQGAPSAPHGASRLVFCPSAQKVLLRGSAQFSAKVKLLKSFKREVNKTLQDGRNYRKKFVQNRQ